MARFCKKRGKSNKGSYSRKDTVFSLPRLTFARGRESLFQQSNIGKARNDCHRQSFGKTRAEVTSHSKFSGSFGSAKKQCGILFAGSRFLQRAISAHSPAGGIASGGEPFSRKRLREKATRDYLCKQPIASACHFIHRGKAIADSSRLAEKRARRRSPMPREEGVVALRRRLRRGDLMHRDVPHRPPTMRDRRLKIGDFADEPYFVVCFSTSEPPQ